MAGLSCMRRFVAAALLLLCSVKADAALHSSGSPTALTNTTLTDVIDQGSVTASSQLNATSNIVYATVPGLSIALTAGKTYVCRGKVFGTSGATGGFKIALVGTGGLTATFYSVGLRTYNGSTVVGYARATTLGNDLANAAAIFTDADFEGTITVGVAGTLNVQGAQSVSNATAASFFQGSTLACKRTN